MADYDIDYEHMSLASRILEQSAFCIEDPPKQNLSHRFSDADDFLLLSLRYVCLRIALVRTTSRSVPHTT